MQLYKVTLTADAYMAAEVTLMAEDHNEARRKALVMADEGRVTWDFNGVNTETIEADSEVS